MNKITDWWNFLGEIVDGVHDEMLDEVFMQAACLSEDEFIDTQGGMHQLLEMLDGDADLLDGLVVQDVAVQTHDVTALGDDMAEITMVTSMLNSLFTHPHRALGAAGVSLGEIHDTDGSYVPCLVVEGVIAGGEVSSMSTVVGLWAELPLLGTGSGWDFSHGPLPPKVSVMVVGTDGVAHVFHDITRMGAIRLPGAVLGGLHTALSRVMVALLTGSSIDMMLTMGGHNHDDELFAGGLGPEALNFDAGMMPILSGDPDEDHLHELLTLLRETDAPGNPLAIMGGLLMARVLDAELESEQWSLSAVFGSTSADRVLAMHPVAGPHLLHFAGPETVMVEPLGGGEVAFVSATPHGENHHDSLAVAVGSYLRGLPGAK